MTGGPNGFPVFALQFDASLIPALASRYSYPPGGRVADEIGPAVRERGYFTRSELIEVCAWKTARSRSRVAANTEEEVRETSRLALSATAEALRIWIPMAMSGVRWPTASVLLHFGHRDRYSILDYRALEALAVTEPVNYTVPNAPLNGRITSSSSYRTTPGMRSVEAPISAMCASIACPG